MSINNIDLNVRTISHEHYRDIAPLTEDEQKLSDLANDFVKNNYYKIQESFKRKDPNDNYNRADTMFVVLHEPYFQADAIYHGDPYVFRLLYRNKLEFESLEEAKQFIENHKRLKTQKPEIVAG